MVFLNEPLTENINQAVKFVSNATAAKAHAVTKPSYDCFSFNT